MSISQYISKSFFSFFSRVLTFLALTIYLYQLCYMELWDQDYWMSAYFLAVLLLITFFVWLEPCEGTETIAPIRKDDVSFLFYLLVLTLILVFTRHNVIGSIAPWLDEFAQSNSSSRAFAPRSSASEHQVPLDYLFSYWSEILFERNNFSMRFFASTFNLLTCLGLYCFAYLICNSSILSFVITLFFSFQYYVYQFGIEARPISMGLFCGLFFFYRYYNLIIKREWVANWRHYGALFAHMLLFLYSVGLQPLFVLLSAAAALLPLLFVKSYRKETLIIEGLFALSIVIFFPFEKYILTEGMPRVSKTLSQMLPLFLENFKLESVVKYGAVGMPKIFLYLLLILVLIVFIFLSFEFVKSKDKKRLLVKVYTENLLLISWVVFPISFATVYYTVVDYPLFPRYVLSGFLIYCLALISLIGSIVALIGNLKFKKELNTLFVFIVTFVFAFYWPQVSPGTPNKIMFRTQRQDVSELFKYIFQNSTELDWLACVAPADRGGCWDFSYITLGFSPTEPQKIRGKTQERIEEAEILDWFIDKLLTKDEPRKLFFVISHIWEESNMSLKAMAIDEFMEIRFFRGIMLIEINNKNHDFKKRLYKLLESMDAFSKSNGHNGRAQYYEILTALDIYFGNIAKAKSRIEELNLMVPEWRKDKVEKLRQIIQKVN